MTIGTIKSWPLNDATPFRILPPLEKSQTSHFKGHITFSNKQNITTSTNIMKTQNKKRYPFKIQNNRAKITRRSECASMDDHEASIK